MTSILRSLAAVPAIVAAFSMPASAASIPGRTLFHHSATAAAKPEYVVINFRNVSLQQRALQVGEERFPLAANSSLDLRVSVGSEVKVRTEVNRKVDGSTLLKVSGSAEKQFVLVN